ncbi:MAG: hypothetical protein ACLFR6_08600, partial [Salinarchaeum sp.]
MLGGVLDGGIDAEPYLDRINALVLEHRVAITLLFLVVTAGFAVGLPNIPSTDSQTDSFTDGLAEQEALDAINEEFGDPFATDGDSTQIIQDGRDVLVDTDDFEFPIL